MIRRITLENFMSHKRTVIEPADGLTVLTGPNNCGKSAVVVALQTLCSNEPSQVFVRHGEKEARILVETSEGHKIEWARRSGKVSYKINGREIHRVGRGGVPDDLHELLKLPQVEDNEQHMSFDIHFAEQKRPIFLLDEPGSYAARFFASSSDAGLLMKMQLKHKQNTAERKTEERLLKQQVGEFERKVNLLQQVPELDRQILTAEKAFDQLQAARSVEANLRSAVEAISETLEEAEYTTAMKAATLPLTPAPVLDDSAMLASFIRSLTDRKGVVQREKVFKETLSGLKGCPVLENTDDLAKLIAKHRQRIRVSQGMSGFVSATRKLKAVPEMLQTSDLQKLVAQMRGSLNHLDGRSKAQDALTMLATPPSLPDDTDLLAMLRRMAELENAVDARRRDLEDVAIHLEALKESAKRFVRENPACPTCGGVLDADRLLTAKEEHVHA